MKTKRQNTRKYRGSDLRELLREDGGLVKIESSASQRAILVKREAAWVAEAERRIDAVNAGKIKTRPAAAVIHDLSKKLQKGSR